MSTSKTKIWMARLALLTIAASIGGILWAAINFFSTITGTTTTKPVTTEIENKEPQQEKAITLAESLADQVARHSSLPERSPLGIGWLGESQESNTASMAAILDTLAQEIGATKAVGAIQTLRELESNERNYEALSKSEDQEVAQTATEQKRKIAEDKKSLQAFVRQELNKEGFDFSQEEIDALCASPNAEDTASMISAFGVLKQISSVMERRLRLAPSQENAQRYYGAHTMLLVSLDKIQKRVIQNIEDKYIPKSQEIAEQALATKTEAETILQEQGLAFGEQTALRWNIESCQTTIRLAAATERKLKINLGILQKANEKLEKSIRAAKNSHMTALLQKEIIQLETKHLEEIARIEALTIPELVGVNFADPTRPEISPARTPAL